MCGYAMANVSQGLAVLSRSELAAFFCLRLTVRGASAMHLSRSDPSGGGGYGVADLGVCGWSEWSWPNKLEAKIPSQGCFSAVHRAPRGNRWADGLFNKRITDRSFQKDMPKVNLELEEFKSLRSR